MSSAGVLAKYAVIFSSQRSGEDAVGYEAMAERMVELAKEQEGFIAVESARGGDGFGITVSYWNSLEAIQKWKMHTEHLVAQERGRSHWYDSFKTTICKVEREYRG